MEFTIIIDIDDPLEQEQFTEELQAFVHNEWWSQYSATVIGPKLLPVE